MVTDTVSSPQYDSSERRAMGKALRNQVPLTAHSAWHPAPDRRDPVDILEESNQGRVPDLVPIRYGRMLSNPFAFLRGSAALMAYDLAPTQVSGIRVQACGDCHLANFGLFATPERNLVFDLNDFDETLPAPWEWDIKRLAASFVVAGRAVGISDNSNKDAVLALAESYRSHLREYSEMRVLDVWYSRLDDKTLIATAPSVKAREFRERVTAKARASVTEYLFPKITDEIGGHRRIVDQPPLVYHMKEHTEIEQRLGKLLEDYHASLPAHLRKLFDHYHYEDFAFKVVGVGSVGTRCFIMLFLADKDDPLLLQVKEARQSVLEAYAGKSEYEHSGKRVVVGQRLMQSASDMFLGWLTGADGTQYYVRQLRDMKFSASLDALKADELSRYAAICGWVLARAHAKGGDAAMISGYLGKKDTFDEALSRFAKVYADQTEKDHARLAKAVKNGRIQAITGY
ncbi:MAG: DUF2252 domain-containing protein [Anaerolineales bacterium]|nr:DUF2252 domain-containing protein [Anaerolineae bacterium]PWB54300.1 MAG: DUF2252 domain-containing protein [Anaerolineales bacterium]